MGVARWCWLAHGARPGRDCPRDDGDRVQRRPKSCEPPRVDAPSRTEPAPASGEAPVLAADAPGVRVAQTQPGAPVAAAPESQVDDLIAKLKDEKLAGGIKTGTMLQS